MTVPWRVLAGQCSGASPCRRARSAATIMAHRTRRSCRSGARSACARAVYRWTAFQSSGHARTIATGRDEDCRDSRRDEDGEMEMEMEMEMGRR